MLQRPNTEEVYLRLWRSRVEPCKRCGGMGTRAAPTDDPFDTRFIDCDCKQEIKRICAMMDANIPKEYWDVLTWEVEHNADVFEAHILRYCEDIAGAREVGRGMLMFGENGVGKTTFAAYIAACALGHGYSIGYVLAYQLTAYAIEARGNSELGAWLRALLGADFLVIDELGKEHKRPDSDFALAELDMLLRTRRGDLKPTIMVTNMNREQFNDAYGASIESIMKGNAHVHFEAGDHRSTLARRSR